MKTIPANMTVYVGGKSFTGSMPSDLCPTFNTEPVAKKPNTKVQPECPTSDNSQNPT